jgi:predicted Zn finger-like uncharacterized protein
MNVVCPECKTVFRVDPEKVPPAGVRARCSVCASVFRVEREPVQSPPSPAPQVVIARPAPAPAPPPPVSEPVRVSAPVSPPAAAPSFVETPPPYRAPSRPAEPAVAATRTDSFAPPPAITTAPTRPVNPFLAQDPMAKARRLARALVSDIVVYNPAKRRDGLRDGSLKALFEEDIRKSWEEYVDQVGRDVADSTTFFTDALNEILADGQRVFS